VVTSIKGLLLRFLETSVIDWTCAPRWGRLASAKGLAASICSDVNQWVSLRFGVRSAFAAAAPAPAADADAAPVRLEPMPNAEDPPKPPAPNVGPAPPNPPRPIVVPAGLAAAAAAAAAGCFFGWGAGRSLWSMYCQLGQMLYLVRAPATATATATTATATATTKTSVPLLKQALWLGDTKVLMQNLGNFSSLH
jgi:hypothetical protein